MKFKMGLLVGLVALVACSGGGGGSPQPSKSDLPPPTVTEQRKLVLDLTDAELLLQPASLASAKEASGGTETPVATDTTKGRIDILLLQKWTKDASIKPALYVTKESTVPGAEPKPAAEGEKPEGETKEAPPPAAANEDVVLDDLIGYVSQVITTTKATFILFNAPFSYNGGKSCMLFQIKGDSGLTCADESMLALASRVSGGGTFVSSDQAGNFYYYAQTSTGKTLRKYLVVEGKTEDLFTGDIFETVVVAPNGTVVVKTTDADNKTVYKNLTAADQPVAAIPTDFKVQPYYDFIGSLTISADGQLIFKGTRREINQSKEGFFKVAFDGSAPVLLADGTQVNLNSNPFWDNEGNVWTGGYNFPLTRLDPKPGSLTSTNKISDSPFYGTGGELYFRRSLATGEKGTRLIQLSVSGGTVKEDVILDIADTYPSFPFFPGHTYIGRSGRLMFALAQKDGTPLIGYKDETGALVTKPLVLPGGGGSIYSLK